MHGMIALEYLFLWFLLYAFVGWVYESILVSISEHRWVNRGFLNGPLCPIYGCGAVLAIVLLRDLHNPVVIFFISSFGACTLEYVTSWGMEKAVPRPMVGLQPLPVQHSGANLPTGSRGVRLCGRDHH